MKRIALIVTGTALLVASCGIASAASRTEVTMPNHVILPYPAELETKALMLAPNAAYQLLNPVSAEQQVAKAEARKHVTRPQYTVSPEQQVARAEHVAQPQYMVSPEQQVARAEHVAGPLKHATKPTSPVIVPQAPTGFGTAACSDTDYHRCSGVGPFSPSPQNNQGTTKTSPDVSQAPAGWIVSPNHCFDYLGCTAIDLVPLPSTAQLAEQSGGSVGSGSGSGSGSRAVVSQTNVPQ